jgi:hypothetical protein
MTRKKTNKNANAANANNVDTLSKKVDRLLSRIPRGTFTTVGGILGGPGGAAIGKGISTLTGYGDYAVTHNSLANKTVIGEMADQVPVFRQQGADTRIRHCEFVADVVAPATPGNFSVTTYSIDPTDPIAFPWLHTVARKYQRYKVRGMVIGYRSTSTDYNNSGVVAIAVNYDPSEEPYYSMEGLLNTKFAVSTKPSCSMIAPVECDPARSPMDGYYVKHATSNDITDATVRQTTLGKINVATTGLTLPAGTALGQLYISYDLELLYPYLHEMQIMPSGMFAGAVDYTAQSNVSAYVDAGAQGIVSGYGTGSTGDVQVKRLNDPTSIFPWVALVFPPGRYTVDWLDSTWTDGASERGVGTPTASAVPGSSITIESSSVNNTGGSTRAFYELTVGPGDEASRTITPHVQTGRSSVGGSNVVTIGLFVNRL